MPMPPTLTEEQRQSITAALFRREDNAAVAAAHGVSERQVRRMIQNLKQYGTVTAPRTKKMGRPNVLTKEIEDDLRTYVQRYPLALLEDMQKHIESMYNVKCSRASLSRRMAEMGFSRGMIRRGFRSTETSLPMLSQQDLERITTHQAENDEREAAEGFVAEGNGSPGGFGSGNTKKTKYAWLTEGEPVRKPKRKKSSMSARSQTKNVPTRHENKAINVLPSDREIIVQPGLDDMLLDGHIVTQEEVDLHRLGQEAQNRIAQSQYPLPIGQQDLPPLHHSNYHPSEPYTYRSDHGQHQLPPLGPVNGTYH